MNYELQAIPNSQLSYPASVKAKLRFMNEF